MTPLTHTFIKSNVAASAVIFYRGQRIYEHGAYACVEGDPEQGRFVYDVDGTYGDYTINVDLSRDQLDYSSDSPYPGKGCKHVVAALLDTRDRLRAWKPPVPPPLAPDAAPDMRDDPYMTPEEIRTQALADRKKRAKNEQFEIVWGDMLKGEHLLTTPADRQYQVTLHDPDAGNGHCTCPDFATNHLGTCKHMIFLSTMIRKESGYKARLAAEKFPFVDIYWDSAENRPRLFSERPEEEMDDIRPLLEGFFDADGRYVPEGVAAFMPLLERLDGLKRVRIQEEVLKRLDDALLDQALDELGTSEMPDLSAIGTTLYPYQIEGVKFGLYRKAALIGDEMGLGKTLQAIAIGMLKKELFGFERILVITLASLKEQWKREIERFTPEKATIVAGGPQMREETYRNDPSLFKITNYEAVLRDVTVISRFKPDLVILDEAQRIKNFETKTADAVKRLTRKHALVLTGTPLENKLEDVYSIIQFLDPYMLAPLWRFAADHFMLSRKKTGKIMGYRNLDLLHDKLKSIVIRRRKEEVLQDLPDTIQNNYYLDLTDEQAKMHGGYAASLLPLLNKKFLTPMDMRRIHELLTRMRQVCDSTYLIDRETHISPKLRELTGILDELVIENKRKVVIFSEWTTMTFLIGKALSEAEIPFVELSGKVPVKKRQALIDEFFNNPDCMVFLSTDAGGTGLNLQAADCVINFELPWNPAKLNQRIGRVNRIGQKSRCVNVVNLITKNSIEERILAGIQLKTELFEGVFDGGADSVEFTRERKTQMLNQLREMMGDEPMPVVFESAASEEIPEDTPHFLNPKALEAEEQLPLFSDEEPATGEAAAALAETAPGGGAVLDRQPPEQVEAVLNS
ncbi:MAG TPA: DEAD/DEAH box helicase, partial [Desulfosarcina sp.]|nr:DEAD/DEAH box helicase [Desulfosarcina sp.]